MRAIKQENVRIKRAFNTVHFPMDQYAEKDIDTEKERKKAPTEKARQAKCGTAWVTPEMR